MFDTVVVGAGPAGATTALVLARAGQRVAILERGRSKERRVGESVPPLVRELLNHLDLWEDFRAQGHRPAYELRSIWNGELRERNSVFNRFGPGFHLDRKAFDEWLLAHALGAGAVLFEPSEIQVVEPSASGGFGIAHRFRDSSATLEARFLVDATGTRAWLGRRLGAERVHGQRLVGIARWFKQRAEPVTLVESAPDGYWYSAPLPDGALVAVWTTDAESETVRVGQSEEIWNDCLVSAPATAERLRGAECIGPAQARATGPAVTRWAEALPFLPVGDAAIGFDPLSGYGLSFALRSACEAAHAIEEARAGRREALVQYRATVEEVFRRHLRSRQLAYAAEQRFSDRVFWQRASAEPRLT